MDRPEGGNTRKVTQEAHRVGVTVDIGEISTRLQNETLRRLVDLTQQGLSDEEIAQRIEASLHDLSDKPIQQAARSAGTEAFNLGRNQAAQDAADQIGTVIRTEVLDDNTCDYCRDVDYTEVVFNSDDYFRLMPPNGCYGRQYCRGFYIYLEAKNA